MQLSFATSPKTLSWMEHNLRTDERVVRHIVVKHRKLTKLPNQHELQRLADQRCVARRRAQRLGRLPLASTAGAPLARRVSTCAGWHSSEPLSLMGRRAPAAGGPVLPAQKAPLAQPTLTRRYSFLQPGGAARSAGEDLQRGGAAAAACGGIAGESQGVDVPEPPSQTLKTVRAPLARSGRLSGVGAGDDQHF